MAEQWSAVYRTSTGELVSVGTVVDPSLPAGLASVVLSGEPDNGVMAWNPATHAFDPRPAQTDDDVLKARPIPQQLNPTSAAGKPALLEFMKERIFEAQAFDWFNTKVQTDGALTAPQKAAVGALNTSLYVRARAAVAAWHGAT